MKNIQFNRVILSLSIILSVNANANCVNTDEAQISTQIMSEELSTENSFVSKQKRSPFNLGLQMQTKYVWRGMEMQTTEATPTLFPSISFTFSGLSVYAMGGYSINGKYAEVDYGASYTWKWLTLAYNDYYYPTVTTANDNYFNYKNRTTGHWHEGALTLSPDKIPVYVTLSNFFAGADKKQDGKQAYSTYVEVGGHYDFIHDNQISLAIGTALNKSCYNGYEHHAGVCSLEAKYTYNLEFRNNWTLPLSVSYILNPIYKKSFVNFTTSIDL